MSEWPNPVILTEAQMELIAEKAAEKAVAKMQQQIYSSIGSTVVRKGLYIIGLGTAVLAAWLAGKGHL